MNHLYAKMCRNKVALVPGRFWAAVACLICLFAGVHSASWVWAGHLSPRQLAAEKLQEQEPNALEASGESVDPWFSLPVEKRKLKLMLGASIAVILGFFLVVLMISLMRMGRHYRRRVFLRQKAKPTEYMDAWSNYRLKENWQDDLPDEFQETDSS